MSVRDAPWNPGTNEESEQVIKVTSETKAVLTAADGGRVVGFVKDDEPGTISLAVPADRAKLTPREARELAAWLVNTANETEKRGDERVFTTAEALRAELASPPRFGR